MEDLSECLVLNVIGNDTFTNCTPLIAFNGRSTSYGGHIVSLAVKAALLTIPSNNKCLINCVHSTYIRPAIRDTIIYEVYNKKDGHTFCYRNVLARQDKKIVFTCIVSFQLPDSEAAHLPYYEEMLAASTPNDSNIGYNSSHRIHTKGVKYFPLHFRFFPPNKSEQTASIEPREPEELYWMASKQPFQHKSQNDHRIALIFATDISMPGVILNVYPNYKQSLVTSLNHCVWFNNDVDINQWNLFNLRCLSSTNGVTLNMSKIFREDGTLIATAVQQGYIRGPKL